MKVQQFISVICCFPPWTNGVYPNSAILVKVMLILFLARHHTLTFPCVNRNRCRWSNVNYATICRLLYFVSCHLFAWELGWLFRCLHPLFYLQYLHTNLIMMVNMSHLWHHFKQNSQCKLLALGQISCKNESVAIKSRHVYSVIESSISRFWSKQMKVFPVKQGNTTHSFASSLEDEVCFV